MLSTLNINKLLFSLISLFQLSLGLAYSQINLRFPAEKSVFQRNNNNSGNIFISGTLGQDAERVEGRLVPRATNQGTLVDWKTIDGTIDGLSFTGSIEGNGGWYRLEIRSIKNNSPLETISIDKVGIGEVFVISGQSNAQGDGNNPNAKGATDERILAFEPNYFNHQFYSINNFPEYLDPGKFTKIEGNTNIGPIGFSAWCYGELGDLLAKRINVPIMFYNVGLSGTSTENWVSSIIGADTYHVGTSEKFERYQPYHLLRKTLQSIVSIYGLRSVLWHQGESDAATFVNEQAYLSNIKIIVQEVRNNTGQKIPFVIARTSRENGRINSNIISAQNKAIAQIEMTWPGPATDDIQPNRPDGAHFENSGGVNGLSLLAEAWNQSLTNQFFNQVTPISPSGLAEIKFSCNTQSDVTLKFDKSFQSYSWSNGSSSSQIRISNGDFTNVLRDGFGNYVFSNRIIFQNVFPKDRPQISAVNSLTGCVGKNIELQASSSKYEVNWNTGKIGNTLTVSSPDQFFAFYRNTQGCLSGKSNDLFTKFVNPPGKPTIDLVNGDGYECIGNTIKLKVNNPQNFDIQWSNGLKTPEIALNSNLPSQLKVTLFSNFDCPSEVSDSAKFAFVNLPKTPILEKNGPFSLKATSIEKVQRYDWFLDNSFLVSKPTGDYIFEKDGIYAAKAVNTYKTPSNRMVECISGLSTLVSVNKNEKLFGINIYPNPTSNGILKIAAEKELKNVTLTIYNSIGGKELSTKYDSLFLPVELNLSSKKLIGKYFIQLKYSGFSRTFPIVFE